MRCFGLFHDDRNCDMCNKIDSISYNKCKEAKLVEVENNKLLNRIKVGYTHRKRCLDEYNFFDGCTKDGDFGRHTKECKPSLECEKHCEGEKV